MRRLVCLLAALLFSESGTTTMNAFVEPQWTVAHEGNNLPKFSLYFGLNLTLGR